MTAVVNQRLSTYVEINDKSGCIVLQFVSILLFALSANLDNFTVAMTYGMRRIQIGIWENLLIALISGVGTLLAMAVGLLVSRFLPASAANLIGGILLIALGIWFLRDFFPSRTSGRNEDGNSGANLNEILKSPEKADADHSGRIDLRECFVLATALTINNFGIGLGASITGLSIPLSTGCTILLSLLSVPVGYKLGEGCLSRFVGRFAPLISGLIVILLGFLSIFI